MNFIIDYCLKGDFANLSHDKCFIIWEYKSILIIAFNSIVKQRFIAHKVSTSTRVHDPTALYIGRNVSACLCRFIETDHGQSKLLWLCCFYPIPSVCGMIRLGSLGVSSRAS